MTSIRTSAAASSGGDSAALDEHVADVANHSSGRELAYAGIVATHTHTSGTPATVIPGSQVTVTVGERPVMVEVYLPLVYNNTANKTVNVHLYEDGVIIQSGYFTSAVANAQSPITVRKRRNLAAGSTHSYEARLQAAPGGVGIANAAMAPTTEGYLSVVER